MNKCNSYLVRIYCRDENNPRLLVGVVKEAGTERNKAFSNLHELWDILNPTRKHSANLSGDKGEEQTQR